MSQPVVLRTRVLGAPDLVIGGTAPPRVGLLVGVTPPFNRVEDEVRKVEAALGMGAATITDLSTGPTSALRPAVMGRVACPVGTVPVYEVFARYKNGEGKPGALVLQVLERQADEGVSFFSIHPSLTRCLAEQALVSRRVIPITSRGGAMLLEMMRAESCENPFLEHWDEITGMAAARGIVLSMVGSLRPGAIADALESLHMSELVLQSDLIRRANARGAATIVELLNHVPLPRLATYMALAGALFNGSPVGALGPTPTDIAVGFDDVAGAIGAAVAVWNGADWLNCTTAGEHIHVPTEEESLRALRHFLLAAHVGTVARAGGSERDDALSRARAANRWDGMEELSIFPDVAGEIIARHGYRKGAACTMCGAECPLVRARRHMPAWRRRGEAAGEEGTSHGR
jgi:phosphomethylpyrimidine synthase